MKKFVFVLLILFFFDLNTKEQIISLEDSINNVFRTQLNRERDIYRNPKKTLEFFEIDKKKKVLEIAPGRGWYTEIISYYLAGTQNFYVTNYSNPSREIVIKIQKEFHNYFKENRSKFGSFNVVDFDKEVIFDNFKKNYFDLVLTFRNTHNWLDAKSAENVYESINKVMKIDGILGVVQHRANEDSKFDFKKGYVKESFLIKLIESKGFKLVEKSEINSNSKDKKDYPKGVWTLPPRLVDKDVNKNEYLSIGESDRMTLKFLKTRNF